MTDDEIKGLLSGLSRLAPPWEVRKVHPFGWDVRSTRWADENTIVAHFSGHGADGDARLCAAAPSLGAEVLRLRGLCRRLVAVIEGSGSGTDAPACDRANGGACTCGLDALLSEARKATT